MLRPATPVTTAPAARSWTARAVVVIDANDNVVYTELVPEIVNEPNYDAALAKVG